MEDKVAAIQSFRAATDTKTTELLILIFIILFLIVTFLFILNFRKALKAKFLKKLFMKTIKEKGLSEKAGDILWKYSTKLGRDPFLTLEVKASFEKAIDLYVQENPDYDEKLIQDTRKKLGFDFVPSFIPLSSTKDIDVFQSGRLTYQDKTFNTSLYDKDERFMYWLLIDVSNPPDLKEKTVKIQFLRRDDAIYVMEGTVSEIITEGEKTVLKIPHHSELKRIQRRQYARIEVDMPVSVGRISENSSEVKWLEGNAKDISAGGMRICIPASQRIKFNLSIGTEIWLNFSLEGRDFQLKGTVVNILERKTTICYGIKFSNIKSKEETHIINFVKKQQQKMRNLAKQRIR
ncbi:PilZ domain-containing protein [Persephonella atlantica]|uniref:PilZ domain-containing protein n=1 Tax=Persephonella atlantica TaxID=2699429 RepID=A0ABS1GG31_9AQUI|nr:PilZ domain-containing protein [Persephonella atlantica]MBK3331835.1 PilZ domain-containing protein [Persephonella atlantica]